jgi:hypothetical protein
MEAVAAAAVTTFGGGLVALLLDIRKRVNGPITAQFAELRDEVRDVKADVRDLRADLRHHLQGDGR